MTAVPGYEKAQAISAFLLDRSHLLLPLAAQLGETQPDFESAIHGSSMSPAIPAGARIRVRPAQPANCQVGDVVFYLAEGGYTVHRVVHRRGRASDTDYLLAEGDARYAPDPPVPRSKVLGTVVAVQIDGEWKPLGPRPAGPWRRRVVRALTLPAMIATMWLSVAAAEWLADLLLVLEVRARGARRRFLHLLARA